MTDRGVVSADNPGARFQLLFWLAAAVALLVLAGILLVRGFDTPDGRSKRRSPDVSAESATRPGAEPATRRVDGRAGRAVPRQAEPRAEKSSGGTVDVSDLPGQDHPDIKAGDYIAALKAAGETEGLAAFSPPGTRPPRAGIIVPDEYELPEGFVRYYQSTDDGRQLDPILTVAPEYDLVDGDGNVVPLATDRIVPPEFAPAGLPVRILEVPSETQR